jgi:hypothetical protein
MRIFSGTRSRFPEPSDSDQRSSRPAPAWAATGSFILLAACIAIQVGCTDDVVCGEEITPYIAARVEQTAAARAGSTYVEVYCVSDPLPGTLVASVTGRQLPQAQEAEGLPGLSTTLSDTQVIWQPGTNCVLEVTTSSGISSALEPVPGAFAVAAPDTIDLGDDLTLSWSDADDADYYLVEGVIDGTASEQPLDVAVDGSSITFGPSEMGLAGVLSGRVWAVAGPFPQSGSSGNVTGEAWGFLSVSYRTPASTFHVVIRDTAGEGARRGSR